VTRRSLLGVGIVSGLAAQQPAATRSREKTETVFLDYDQAELDAAYDQSAYAPNQAQIGRRAAINSELVRARLGAPARIAYGPSTIERLDIYRTAREKSPVNIFVHGGAWRGGSAAASASAAELFVKAGAHYVALDFASVRDTDGSLGVMAEQIQRAVAWIYKNAASFGGDPTRLYISAHSSGAHLAAVALTTDWWKESGLPNELIRGALLASGMYDLKGPRLSSRSSYVKFDDATEEALSPQRHIGRLNTPLIVAYAGLDTPEFQRQSREFAASVKAAGKPVELIRGENYNHFEFIETLANPYGVLGRAAVAQMGLG